jgi:hypothetical protein
MLARLLVSYALSAPDDPPEVVAALVADLVTHGVAPQVRRRPAVAPSATGVAPLPGEEAW